MSRDLRDWERARKRGLLRFIAIEGVVIFGGWLLLSGIPFAFGLNYFIVACGCCLFLGAAFAVVIWHVSEHRYHLQRARGFPVVPPNTASIENVSKTHQNPIPR